MTKQIPPGYKQTKVGIIPNDWKIIMLKQLLSQDIQNGYSPICAEEDTGHWILGLGALTQQKINLNEKKPAPLYDKKVKIFTLKTGDFLISRSNTPDRVGFSGLFLGEINNCSYPDLMMKFRVNENLINPIFCDYSLKTTPVMKHIKKSASGSSSSMVKINKAIVENITFAIPSMIEQIKIVEILSEWDIAITKQEQLIEQKQIFKKGIMQQIFNQKIRFKDDNGNDYPAWQKFNLYNVLKERKTYQNKGSHLEHVSLTKLGVIPKSERYERDFLVKSENKQYKITYKNDICYNPANLKFGVICRNNYGNGIFSPIYVTFEVNQNFNVQFIEYLFTRQEFIQQIRKYEEGTVYERMAVSPEDFLSFTVALPSLAEQNKLAGFLTNIKDEIIRQTEILNQLKLQKQSLVQKLLTGQVRVRHEN